MLSERAWSCILSTSMLGAEKPQTSSASATGQSLQAPAGPDQSGGEMQAKQVETGAHTPSPGQTDRPAAPCRTSARPAPWRTRSLPRPRHPECPPCRPQAAEPQARRDATSHKVVTYFQQDYTHTSVLFCFVFRTQKTPWSMNLIKSPSQEAALPCQCRGGSQEVSGA